MTGIARVALSSAVAGAGQAAKAAPGWEVPRMPDGHPDLQGVWANNTTPLERPKQFGLRARMTDAEFAEVKKNLSSMIDGDAFFADELILAAVDGKTKFSSAETQTGNYGQAWLRNARSTTEPRSSSTCRTAASRRPRHAPSSGRAARRVKDAPGRLRAGHGASTRCVHSGTPNLRAGQSYFAVTQGPGVVALRTEMIHDTRSSGLPAHTCRRPSRYHGDRGRTGTATRSSSIPPTSRPTRAAARRPACIWSKIQAVAADTIEHYVTIDDPAAVAPVDAGWSAQEHGRADAEFACHEGNYGLRYPERRLRQERGTN
jgi:hypothetical protein